MIGVASFKITKKYLEQFNRENEFYFNSKILELIWDEIRDGEGFSRDDIMDIFMEFQEEKKWWKNSSLSKSL